MEEKQKHLQQEETTSNTLILLENQLLATKFYVPVAPDTLISRPRLSTLLDQSLERPLTLTSAPAGFGKTTLLATWGQTLPANNPQLAWVSLDEEDNDPRLFWTYVLTALNRQQPQRFTPLLMMLQSPQAPSIKYVLNTLVTLKQWLEQLPAEVMGSRPHLCLACTLLMWAIVPNPVLEAWLTAAEATLTMQTDISHTILATEAREEHKNLLGQMIGVRALLQCFEAGGQAALPLCQQALTLISAENFMTRALISIVQFVAYYTSSDAMAAVQIGLQASSLAQAAQQPVLALVAMSATAQYMLGMGRLHEAEQLTQQAMLQGKQPYGLVLPEKGYIRSFVDEGTPMETLFYQLQKQERKSGPTPYLDTVIAAFQQESMLHIQAEEPTKAQALPKPLSEREREILHLLARGASNQEIAQELVIVIDTVKRHVSHIFSKLGVQNRVQAVRQAEELGLLGEEL